MNSLLRLALFSLFAAVLFAGPGGAAHRRRLDLFTVLVSGDATDLYVVAPGGGVVHATSPGLRAECSIPDVLVAPTFPSRPGMVVDVNNPRPGRWFVVVCATKEWPDGVTLARNSDLNTGCDTSVWVKADTTRVLSVRWFWSDQPSPDCRFDVRDASPREARILLAKLGR